MSYANPQIPLIDSPVGIDAVIQYIQELLAERLPWLDKSFGRAREFNEDGKRAPKVYVGNGEYYNVLPNDHLKSQSYIMTKGAEFPDGMGKERQISIVFWFNLKEIYPAVEHVYTEELKLEVEAVLRSAKGLKSIDAYYDDRVEDVFDGYASSRGRDYVQNSEYLMHPYSGFRFDITVGYPNDPCFDWKHFTP